jgi:hypothetical protein
MNLTRRSFLKLSAAAAAGIVIPALTPPRAPYVSAGESVSYVGLNKHPAPTFTGSTLVRSVGEWDGVGYPCALQSQCVGRWHELMSGPFYDFDLVDFKREAREFSWADPANKRYPNIHAYVRERRFGELPDVMWQRLGYTRTATGWLAADGHVAWS